MLYIVSLSLSLYIYIQIYAYKLNQHHITSHTSKLALSSYTMGPYITILAPWGAKLLIWMPLQAYRFQGLEGGSEGTYQNTHQWFVYNCKWESCFLKTNTHIYIYWKKTHKNKTPRNLLIHLGDASMSTCHSKGHVQIIMSQDLFKISFNFQEDS